MYVRPEGGRGRLVGRLGSTENGTGEQRPLRNTSDPTCPLTPLTLCCTQEAKVYKTILTENKTEQDRIHVKNVKPKSHSDLVRIKLSAKPKEDV